MNQPQGDMVSTKEDIVASQTVESKCSMPGRWEP